MYVQLMSNVVWHQNFTATDKPALVGLEGITQGEPTTMLYDFDHSQLEELTRGIEAPICEFVSQPSTCFDGSIANTYAGLYPPVS
jgi:hypothetical protein